MDRDVSNANTAMYLQEQERLAHAVSIHDVVGMTQARLSDEVIINHIRANGVAVQPQVSDLIAMQQAGVSGPVIRAMQEGTRPQPVIAPVPVQPVVVEEHHYVAPQPWWHHHRPARVCRPPGIHWGISIRK